MTNYVFIPNANYRSAMSLRANGRYDEAIAIFESLAGFRDAPNQVKLTRAAQSFANGMFMTGTDYVCDAGGYVRAKYDSDGGSLIDERIIREGWLDLAPAKSGYSFYAWTQTDWGMDNYAFTLSLKANWTLLKYTIAYYLEGGYFETPPVYEYDVNTPTFVVPEPKRDGYVFQGWRIGAFGSDPIKNLTIEAGSTKNYVLTASWGPGLNKLNVASEDTAKGTVAIISGSGYSGEATTVQAFPAANYVFLGWYHESRMVSDNETYTFAMPPNDYSLVARFLTKTEGAALAIRPVLSDNGQKVTYGLYPQTRVSDSALLKSLNALTTQQPNGWYLFDGTYYAKHTAVPHDTNYVFDDGTRISSGTTYWFKCEPIVWTILSHDTDQYYLLSSVLLDAHRYSEPYEGIRDGHYSCNYEYSEIREWLNDDFYSSAFALGFSSVQTTIVDNSAASTDGNSSPFPYTCDDTHDKVFLPSSMDYTNPDYGFSSQSDGMCKTTDWARARGAFCSMNYDYNGDYWTRSPTRWEAGNIRRIDCIGTLWFSGVGYAECSVRPAITLKL